MVIVKEEAPKVTPEMEEAHKASMAEFQKLQTEYYVNLAEEMKDDCETYKKGTECHDYARILMDNLPRAKDGLAQFEFNCNSYKIGASCDGAANAYAVGRDVARDPDKVIGYYTKACLGDYPQSCLKLAKLYQYGKLGIVKDTAKAFEFLTIGCRKNQTATCAALGVAHLQGMGTEKNCEAALPILENACERGVGQACHNLGTMYYKGEGVKKDKALAKQYHVKSKILKGELQAFDREGRPTLPQNPGRQGSKGQL